MRRWGLGIAAIGFLLLGVAGVSRLRAIAHMRAMAVGLVAKQMCSCLLVDGRDAASCRGDLPPDTDYIAIEVDAPAGSVLARAPLAPERTARHTDGSGCTLY